MTLLESKIRAFLKDYEDVLIRKKTVNIIMSYLIICMIRTMRIN